MQTDTFEKATQMTATPNPSSKTAPRLPIQAAPLLFVVLIDSLSYSIVLPFLPSMILQHGGGVLLGGLLVALPAFCTMVSAPLLGRLADRAGSRRVLLFTLAGAVASYAML
ncbi:MAG: MFS transporter, partial [bacterium]